MFLCHVGNALGTVATVVMLEELSIPQVFALAHHVGKLSVAVVDKLDKDVIGRLARSPVEEEHLDEVAKRHLVIDLDNSNRY